MVMTSMAVGLIKLVLVHSPPFGEMTLKFATYGTVHYWLAGPEVATKLKNKEAHLCQSGSVSSSHPCFLMVSVRVSVSFTSGTMNNKDKTALQDRRFVHLVGWCT